MRLLRNATTEECTSEECTGYRNRGGWGGGWWWLERKKRIRGGGRKSRDGVHAGVGSRAKYWVNVSRNASTWWTQVEKVMCTQNVGQSAEGVLSRGSARKRWAQKYWVGVIGKVGVSSSRLTSVHKVLVVG
ncbi:hypothetical protein T552_04101 [Pneumocystis carinii B80]|uniref:Uncharacterized protein n=1 Tax=Pneumocystis carinii (strain B80) TaxID=1408658 RepID=A0A0W4ZNH7_PNEC8|nr:hypothetical protein T552_04101 [Pneumocystis carinii B80]KTW29913.1 hypothetical protein T552_04101 [Pneumocystis carinii B80]